MFLKKTNSCFLCHLVYIIYAIKERWGKVKKLSLLIQLAFPLPVLDQPFLEFHTVALG